MSCLERELELLQKKNWNEKEREMIKSLVQNIKYYRKLIPNSLKKDICEALNMCNELKIELDSYRRFCENKNLIYADGTIIKINEGEEKEYEEKEITEKMNVEVNNGEVNNDIIVSSSTIVVEASTISFSSDV